MKDALRAARLFAGFFLVAYGLFQVWIAAAERGAVIVTMPAGALAAVAGMLALGLTLVWMDRK